LGNLGNAYAQLKQYQKAIEFNEQALANQKLRRKRTEDEQPDFLITLTPQADGELTLDEIKRKLGDRHGEAQTLQNLQSITKPVVESKKDLPQQAATQIFQELDLPMEAWALPQWMKSLVKFAQKGKGQLVVRLASNDSDNSHQRN
jgi:tetratricopeptide (TPR) repeat protein